MQVRMHADHDLSLSAFAEPGFDIEADDGAHAHFSALEMFATGLGLCTASVLIAYGEHVGADPHDLVVRVRWQVEEARLSDLALDVRWPSLPESRLKAAERAAKQCTIHRTLEHPPPVRTTVSR